MPDKLPEQFAPTGPKLSRFPIRPAPPIRPHLFADEARWVFRLVALVGVTEFVAWYAFGWTLVHERRTALLFAIAALAKPLWARLGVALGRAAVASTSLLLALAFTIVSVQAPDASVAAFWLPALADLVSSAAADAITIERRPAAFSRLEMGRSIGAAIGLAAGLSLPNAIAAAAALILAVALTRALRDRGTPRSTWPAAAWLHALRTPLGVQVVALSLVTGLLLPRLQVPWWLAFALPLGGMILAARIEPLLPNATWLPRIAAGLALAGRLWPPLWLLATGMSFTAIPASAARGSGEMERPLVSSLAWSALILGAAVGAVV
ncbi:MAG TPA: hypothetical protein VLW85_08070 [Myxococcales bacterium]|nr:hypothetical protein [Myxococcales bacterium]